MNSSLELIPGAGVAATANIIIAKTKKETRTNTQMGDHSKRVKTVC